MNEPTDPFIPPAPAFFFSFSSPLAKVNGVSFFFSARGRNFPPLMAPFFPPPFSLAAEENEQAAFFFILQHFFFYSDGKCLRA